MKNNQILMDQYKIQIKVVKYEEKVESLCQNKIKEREKVKNLPPSYSIQWGKSDSNVSDIEQLSHSCPCCHIKEMMQKHQKYHSDKHLNGNILVEGGTQELNINKGETKENNTQKGRNGNDNGNGNGELQDAGIQDACKRMDENKCIINVDNITPLPDLNIKTKESVKNQMYESEDELELTDEAYFLRLLDESQKIFNFEQEQADENLNKEAIIFKYMIKYVDKIKNEFCDFEDMIKSNLILCSKHMLRNEIPLKRRMGDHVEDSIKLLLNSFSIAVNEANDFYNNIIKELPLQFIEILEQISMKVLKSYQSDDTKQFNKATAHDIYICVKGDTKLSFFDGQQFRLKTFFYLHYNHILDMLKCVSHLMLTFDMFKNFTDFSLYTLVFTPLNNIKPVMRYKLFSVFLQEFSRLLLAAELSFLGKKKIDDIKIINRLKTICLVLLKNFNNESHVIMLHLKNALSKVKLSKNVFLLTIIRHAFGIILHANRSVQSKLDQYIKDDDIYNKDILMTLSDFYNKEERMVFESFKKCIRAYTKVYGSDLIGHTKIENLPTVNFKSPVIVDSSKWILHTLKQHEYAFCIHQVLLLLEEMEQHCISQNTTINMNVKTRCSSEQNSQCICKKHLNKLEYLFEIVTKMLDIPLAVEAINTKLELMFAELASIKNKLQLLHFYNQQLKHIFEALDLVNQSNMNTLQYSHDRILWITRLYTILYILREPLNNCDAWCKLLFSIININDKPSELKTTVSDDITPESTEEKEIPCDSKS